MAQDQYLSKYFSILANPKLYSSLLYLALAFPLGLTYFILLVVGFSVGVSLLIIWVGFIILAFVFPLIWLIINFERVQTIHLLGISLPENKPQPIENQSLVTKIKGFLTDPATWRGLLFIVLKFPIGIVAFVALVTGFALVFACMFSPLFYQFGTINLGFWQVDTLSEAIGLSLISLMVLPGLCHFYYYLAQSIGKFSTYLLKPQN